MKNDSTKAPSGLGLFFAQRSMNNREAGNKIEKMRKCLFPVGQKELEENHVCNNRTVQAGERQYDILPPFQQCKMGIVERIENKGDDGWYLSNQITLQRRRMADELYTRMLPAIELATIMFHYCEPFFAKIVFCPRQRQTSQDGRMVGTQFDPNWRYTNAEQNSYKTNMQPIFEECRFNFIRQRGDVSLWNKATGFSSSGKLDLYDLSRGVTGDAMLHPTFLEFYSDPNYDTLPRELKERVHVVLATLLIHEFCHIINYGRLTPCGHNPRFNRPNPCPECSHDPRYGIDMVQSDTSDTSGTGELGLAWEYYLFGLIFDMQTSSGTINLKEMVNLRSISYRDEMTASTPEEHVDPTIILPHEAVRLILGLSQFGARFVGGSRALAISKAESEGSLDYLIFFRNRKQNPPPGALPPAANNAPSN